MTRQSAIKVVAGAAVAAVIALAAGPALADSLSGGSADTAPPTTSTTVAGGAPAPTAGTGDLTRIKARAKAAIDARVASLDHMLSVLQADTGLGSDQAVLVSTAQKDVAGLQQLAQTIAADTTVAQAKADAQTIFTAYRVYALVLPVDRMVRAADRATGVAIPRLDQVAARAAGSSNPTVASLAADIRQQTQAASQALAGLAARVEGYTPAEWNANHQLLTADRADVKTALQDLQKARDDVKQIRQQLRSGRPADRAAG